MTRVQVIKKAQAAIQELENKQSLLFVKCLKNLDVGINDEPEATIIFDYLYNKGRTATSVIRCLGKE